MREGTIPMLFITVKLAVLLDSSRNSGSATRRMRECGDGWMEKYRSIKDDFLLLTVGDSSGGRC